jgi:hypothetical protein
MGVEELSDERQTRRSTRSSTKSQTPAPVTPPTAKKAPTTPNSSRRGRKKKIEEEVTEEAEKESEEEKNVEQIIECEAQPPMKRQKLSETIQKNEEKATIEGNTDKLDGPSSTADNEVKAATPEPEKENGDSVEENMEVDEPIFETSSANIESVEGKEENVSRSRSTSHVAQEIKEPESTPITVEDSSKDQANQVASSVDEYKLGDAVKDSSEVISIEDEASVESLPTISTIAVTEKRSMAMLVESSSSDEVEEVVAKATVESTSSEAKAESESETKNSEVVHEKLQEIEAMEVDSSSVVLTVTSVDASPGKNYQENELVQSEPQESSLSESNEVQHEAPAVQTGEIQVNDVQPTEGVQAQTEASSTEVQVEELLVKSNSEVEVPSESPLLPSSDEVVEEEKTISSTEDVETKIEMSQGEDGSIAKH